MGEKHTMTDEPLRPMTEPLMTPTPIHFGIQIGKVAIKATHGSVGSCWLSIEGPAGETHKIRITSEGYVLVMETDRRPDKS